MERLPEEFNMAEIMQKNPNRSPYILVCFQECERMNVLLREIRVSLQHLDLGLKVDLQVGQGRSLTILEEGIHGGLFLCARES